MRANEKTSNLMPRKAWSIYGMYDDILGVVLDDAFEEPHIHVYEHERHTFEEIYLHLRSGSSTGVPDVLTSPQEEELSEEELDVLKALCAREEHRMLRIVGDVGVGKSTFLRHLCSMHFPRSGFGSLTPFYLDWRGFTASRKDPIPEIRRKFAQKIFAEFEKKLSQDDTLHLDSTVFARDELFAPSRVIILKTLPVRQAEKTDELIAEKLEEDPAEYALARLRTLGKYQRKSCVLIFDNVDQIPQRILSELFQFIINIQNNNPFLVIVAMRDHTSGRFSAYEKHAVVPGWHMRLLPPNIKLTLERRLDYFFPKIFDGSKHSNLFAKTEAGAHQACCALILSPFVNPATYEFLSQWSNFSIRSLFSIIPRIISYPGLETVGSPVILGKPFPLEVDHCLMALSLGRNIHFHAEKSLVFNVYSPCVERPKLDLVTAARLLQFLVGRKQPVPIAEVRALFAKWGYPLRVFDEEVRAMLNKDVLWADSGDPEDFTQASSVRLSYRGQLYTTTLMSRAIYNYMMSFDVSVPSSNVLYSSSIEEAIHFADLKEELNAERLITRVLALARLLKEAEEEELQMLRTKNKLNEFQQHVSPKGIALGIVRGLVQFFSQAMLAGREDIGRKVIQPPYAVLQEIDALRMELTPLSRDISGHDER